MQYIFLGSFTLNGELIILGFLFCNSPITLVAPHPSASICSIFAGDFHESPVDCIIPRLIPLLLPQSNLYQVFYAHIFWVYSSLLFV